ncbi:MAG: hypothetical protein GX593_14360 [Actinomycetales bacterium]|nr:hypothetical protein [Actinomycetales bacterium]
MTGVRRRGTLIVLAVVLALAGCAHEPAEKVPLWEHLLSDPPGLEADPPQSLAELVDYSELVVRGSVVKVRKGPTERYGSGDAQAGIQESRSPLGLETVRDPAAGHVLPDGVSSLDDLAALLRG